MIQRMNRQHTTFYHCEGGVETGPSMDTTGIYLVLSFSRAFNCTLKGVKKT